MWLRKAEWIPKEQSRFWSRLVLNESPLPSTIPIWEGKETLPRFQPRHLFQNLTPHLEDCLDLPVKRQTVSKGSSFPSLPSQDTSGSDLAAGDGFVSWLPQDNLDLEGRSGVSKSGRTEPNSTQKRGAGGPCLWMTLLSQSSLSVQGERPNAFQKDLNSSHPRNQLWAVRCPFYDTTVRDCELYVKSR